MLLPLTHREEVFGAMGSGSPRACVGLDRATSRSAPRLRFFSFGLWDAFAAERAAILKLRHVYKKLPDGGDALEVLRLL